jgi:UDP-glucose 4-epimerase
VNVPPELQSLMRFGRGVDNRKYKATGFNYRYTTRETVLKLGEHLRLSPILKGAREPYRYEREVEEFLRWSPSVQGSESPLMRMSPAEIAELQKLLEGIAAMQKPAPAPEAAEAAEPKPEPLPDLGLDDYDELEAEEIIAHLGSMERRELEALRELESASRARPGVLHAIDSVLARVPTAG